jgi:hypothetical protein
MGLEACVVTESGMPDIMLDQIPSWVCWIAQDRDGTWWGYEHEPNMADTGWYENEVGALVKLMRGDPNPAWNCSLRKL